MPEPHPDRQRFAAQHAQFVGYLRAVTHPAQPAAYGPFTPDQSSGPQSAHRFAFFAGVGRNHVDTTAAFTAWLERIGDPLEYVTPWRSAYCAIPLDRPAERLDLLAPYVAGWLRMEKLQGMIRHMGAVAAVIVQREGLYQEFVDLFQAQHGIALPRSFRSPVEFIAALRQAFGLGPADEGRVRHELKGAELWLDLEGDGLPLPPLSSRLERLAYRDDAREIYRELCHEANHTAPSHSAIEARLDALEGKPQRIPPGIFRRMVDETADQAIAELLKPETDKDRVIAMLRKLKRAAAPRKKTLGAFRTPKVVPQFDPAHGAAFVLQDEAGDLLLAIAPQTPQHAIDRVWSTGKAYGWESRDGDNLRWRIPVSRDNPDMARAQRSHAQDVLKKLAVLIGSPVPVLPDRRVTRAQ